MAAWGYFLGINAVVKTMKLCLFLPIIFHSMVLILAQGKLSFISHEVGREAGPRCLV